MKMKRLNIQLPTALKAKLDALRGQGTTASGYIRSLLERELYHAPSGQQKGAKELDIPVIVLSQLSRACESRHDKRAMLSDLRDSGAIEQDADIVLFLYREEVYNPETEDKGLAEVLIRKHRNGPIGDRRLRFVDCFARFEEMDQVAG